MKGAIQKYVTPEGGDGQMGCDKGRGVQEPVMSRFREKFL